MATRLLPAKTSGKWADVLPDWRSLMAAVTGFAAFGILAYLSIELTRGAGRIAVVWLPNAIAVAAMLRISVKHEWLFLAGLFAGNLTANLAVGDAFVTGIVLSVANLTEIALAVFLVRKFAGPRPRMEESRDLLQFFLSAGLIAPLASATIASLALHNAGATLQGVLNWAVSDSLSMVILAPSMLVFWDALAAPRLPKQRKLLEWAVLTVAGTATVLFVFLQNDYPFLFLIPPLVVCHAFRLGTVGTAFSVLKVAIIALVCTQMGFGPVNLNPLPTDEQLLVLEAFLASSMLVGLPVAAVLSTRDRMAREVSMAKKRFALLAANITDAVLRYDLHGVCTYASPSVERVLGCDPSDLIGMTTGERVHPESREAIASSEERLLSGKSQSERFTYRRFLDGSEGRPVYIEADCALAFDTVTGDREGIVVSARDVTNRVMLERKLKCATHHAENAARAKAQFLANMSHEIRTPMNGVLGFADLLARMDLDPEASRYAELISRSGHSMMMLLNDILDISKIESGQLVISEESFELPRLAEDCVRLHMAGAERKGVGLALTCASDVPERILSDPLRLRQILLNLIGNAVKFTEHGQVEISVMRENEQLAISVEDSGIGIDPDRIEHIFDPFIQEEASTTRRFGGTGLGLSISRQLAELLGGKLTADSMPGVGSRFSLRIPLEEVLHRDPDGGPLDRRASQPAAPPPSARVLLAEDYDVNRLLVTAMLEELGQEVTIVHDGTQAISTALDGAENGQPFDLVLMDIQMPGCDGYAASQAIRRGGLSASALPIIALTANAFPEDIAAARDAGMQGHLAKPLVFEALAAVLARWLPVTIVSGRTGDVTKPAWNRSEGRHSPQMIELWNSRRAEAIGAVTIAVQQDKLEGVRVEDLARTVHKLAGTAGMFGEKELGEKAAALERALRSGVEAEVRRKLAEELLAAA